MNDREGEFKQGRLSRTVGKITTADTFDEIAEMDFVDYGDVETFLHLRDTFSRYSWVTFIGTKKGWEKRMAK